MADIPEELKPEDEPNCYYCLSKEKAQKVEQCFQREKEYQTELDSEISSSPIWGYVLAGIVGFAVGAVVIH